MKDQSNIPDVLTATFTTDAGKLSVAKHTVILPDGSRYQVELKPGDKLLVPVGSTIIAPLEVVPGADVKIEVGRAD